jgi:hypothetical protein
VRENCPPGSERGRSGNWPSYRDDLPPGPNARVELLIAIAQADSTPAFDRIAQKLAVVVGTEL